MSTLAEIEATAKTLPPQGQQELPLFHAVQLHAAGALPPHGGSPKEQIDHWIADNTVGYRVAIDKALDHEN